jgi:hypothetical protein
MKKLSLVLSDYLNPIRSPKDPAHTITNQPGASAGTTGTILSILLLLSLSKLFFPGL